MLRRRLSQRYVTRLRSSPSTLDQLAEAIHTLCVAGSREDPFFLAHSLELLVKNLGASQATLVMDAGSGSALETRWWYPEEEEQEPPIPIASLCAWLMENPERVLVARDFDGEEHFRNNPELRKLPFKAALGCVIRHGSSIQGLVFVFFSETRSFPPVERALLDAVISFIGRILEVQDLKLSLHRLEDALAITKAVMEDSSIRDRDTDLPNLRYLEIWQKAKLGSGTRPQPMVVAECLAPVRSKYDISNIRKASEGVRAGDLMVCVGAGRFLILFQHMSRSLAHVLLLKLRTRLGGKVPMAATMWVPDKDGLVLDAVRLRLAKTLEESNAMKVPALLWNIPEGWME